MENEWRPAVFFYSEGREKKEKSCLRNSIQPRLRRCGNFLENPPLGKKQMEMETRKGGGRRRRRNDVLQGSFHSCRQKRKKKTFSHLGPMGLPFLSPCTAAGSERDASALTEKQNTQRERTESPPLDTPLHGCISLGCNDVSRFASMPAHTHVTCMS